MLAPGKRPFDTVPPWAGDGLSNGDGGPGLSAEQEDRCGMFPQNQLVPVPPLVVFFVFFYLYFTRKVPLAVYRPGILFPL